MAQGRVRFYAGLALASLALAACSSGGDGEAGSADGDGRGEPPSLAEMKEAARELVKPEPGLYARTITIENFEAPGLPAEIAGQVKGMMARDRTENFCLTRAEAEDGFRDMFENVGETSNCSYDRFAVTDGALDAQMTCAHPSQGTAVMTLQGTASATTSDVTMEMNVTGGQAPMSEMNMKMRMVSKRTGDCEE
ncbi:DUF3617 domain-containing protein [Novosphingobium mangrovi (ex Hu et al. 2023)]|uniref:DUF3617 domain-containing protein n=1 Tax=Novosphingobium mangrovi (ex Hu et al. 2023) TaxID=2930094 RepID=A0ABT0AG93_9SPHN|nr:DUF3617 domain-containing protein [Novosphingobium mangrovi (ex Hu et al. 2023)]MCJ1962194.1 DUF3617 domain-containing protein [Novosphingobium mangrovi (ex Hu et al. 2023)]